MKYIYVINITYIYNIYFYIYMKYIRPFLHCSLCWLLLRCPPWIINLLRSIISKSIRNKHTYLVTWYSLSSSCSLRVRCVPCSLVLKVELVPPSLLRSSNVPSSFWPVFQCLSWESISFHHLYVLYPLFLVLFHFLYYVLYSRFFPNTLILVVFRCVVNS